MNPICRSESLPRSILIYKRHRLKLLHSLSLSFSPSPRLLKHTDISSAQLRTSPRRTSTSASSLATFNFSSSRSSCVSSSEFSREQTGSIRFWLLRLAASAWGGGEIETGGDGLADLLGLEVEDYFVDESREGAGEASLRNGVGS